MRVSIRYLWVAAVLSCAHKEGAVGPSSAEIRPAGQVLRSRRSGDIVSRPGLGCCGLDRVEEIAIMFLFSTAHRVLPCRSDNVVNNDNVDDVKNDKNVENIDNDGNFHSVAITSSFDTVDY